MIIRSSIRQMVRTPLKTVLFLVLLVLSAALLMLGANLWQLSEKNIQAFEKIFTTIGTVEQKKESVQRGERWDAETKSYTYYNTSVYGGLIPLSVLDFEGAGYIHRPERRPYYGAYHEDYNLGTETNQWDGQSPVVEVTPYEDCVPDHPVKMKINKVLYGLPKTMTMLRLCDHFNPDPEPLYADKTYIMTLKEWAPHKGNEEMGTEYIPAEFIGSTQFTKDGKRAVEYDDTRYEEVTDGFYEDGRGKRWLELITAMDRREKTIPVTPTDHTELLMSFYSGEAYICQGRDISEAEYQGGSKVCLISAKFAGNNGLDVGDEFALPLYWANYSSSAGKDFNKSGERVGNYLNTDAEMYPVFEDSLYKIVGVYETSPASMLGKGYGMGENEVVIPAASVKNSDENNIMDFGPMKGYNTSFQIENGKIEEYMELWNQQGIEGLEIVFYDKGYTQLKAGLDNMKYTAMLLLAAGGITAFLILVFFCHLFIVRQRRRTAIERSLGMSRRQCAVSMLAGIVLLAMAGSAGGIACGWGLTQKAAADIQQEAYFDHEYSSSALKVSGDAAAVGIDYTLTDIRTALLTGVVLVIMMIAISLAEIRKNLQMEPLLLLSQREE